MLTKRIYETICIHGSSSPPSVLLPTPSDQEYHKVPICIERNNIKI